MGVFEESLTVRILADSGPFRSELQNVASLLSDFESRMNRLSSLGQQLQPMSDSFAGMSVPLERVSGWLDRIATQIARLRGTPVTLDVSPALNALAQLSRAIAAVAAQLASLRAFASAGVGGFGSLAGGGSRVAGFAEGGLVTGAAGRDRVPAMLSAGEFVLREPVVDRLGTGFLDQLNSGTLTPPANANRGASVGGGGSTTPGSGIGRAAAMSAVPVGDSMVNHFGGITIQVNQAVDLDAVVRDLRFQGFQLRNRRG